MKENLVPWSRSVHGPELLWAASSSYLVKKVISQILQGLQDAIGQGVACSLHIQK